MKCRDDDHDPFQFQLFRQRPTDKNKHKSNSDLKMKCYVEKFIQENRAFQSSSDFQQLELHHQISTTKMYDQNQPKSTTTTNTHIRTQKRSLHHNIILNANQHTHY